MIERSGFVHKEIQLCALSLSSAVSCSRRTKNRAAIRDAYEVIKSVLPAR